MARCALPVSLLLVAAASGAAAEVAAAAQQPNFLVFLVDDWGWGDLGANGFGAETPSMDRYAAKGVLFRDFHANSVCTPTRSALQTGRLNMRMGVTGNFDVDSKGGLALGEVTVAQLLQRGANYSTSATGKCQCLAAQLRVAVARVARRPGRSAYCPPRPGAQTNSPRLFPDQPPPLPQGTSATAAATAARTAATTRRGAATTVMWACRTL